MMSDPNVRSRRIDDSRNGSSCGDSHCGGGIPGFAARSGGGGVPLPRQFLSDSDLLNQKQEKLTMSR